MQLPFLVVHAALVWKVVLVAFVALCVAIFLAIRYLLVRSGNRTEVKDLDTKDPGVIRGRLRGGTASTLYVTPKIGATKQANVRSGELEISTAEGDVVLEGEIRVAAGSHVAARRRRIPAETPAHAEAHATLQNGETPIALAVVHEVLAGDEVIAKGTLVSEAGDQVTDYRENATRRVLRGSITIAARRPMTTVVRPSLPILGVVIAVSAFAGYKIESLCGDAWRDTCHDGADLDLANTNACVLANAMPNQDGALGVLLDELDRRPAPSETRLQERILLSRLVEDCRASIFRLERIDRPELLLEEARRCGDFEAQQVALTELGRFGEAAAVPAALTTYRDEVSGRIFALAGAWGQAAGYAEQRAITLRSKPPEGDPDRRDRTASEIVAWQCIGALMHFYASASPISVARIRELALGPHGEQCTPELAEVGSDQERARALGKRHDLATPWRALEVERQLAGLGIMKNDGVPAMLLQGSDASGMAYPAAVWATRLAPPVADTADVEARFDDATHRLAIAVWMHDFAAAHRYADVAIALATDELRAGYDAQFKTLFHPMIDLYTAKTPLTVPPPLTRDDALDNALAGIWIFMTAHLAIRHGDPLDTRAFVVTKEMHEAMTAAQHGDGALLATILGDDSIVRQLDLIAVLPMVKTHREELVRALAWMPVQSQIVDYRFPFGTAQYYAERRTMFELAGDTANAKRADDVFQRYAAAFHDHRRLVALALLDF